MRASWKGLAAALGLPLLVFAGSRDVARVERPAERAADADGAAEASPAGAAAAGIAAGLEGDDAAGETWVRADLGLRMAIPQGWSALERGRWQYLMRDPGDSLGGSFNLIWLPNAFGHGLDELAEENRAALAAEGFEVEALGRALAGGRPCLRVAYRGTPPGRVEEVRFLALVLLKGNRQIVLTACARADDWAAIECAVEDSLGSLELDS